ncbi:PREDICTED: coiled-coil-helix-coiled-coil-helix domain-containing protein 1 isoform X1 [Gavialis gangeticus]|uniref:coiled-coil-helix-coiled-coil-helix domain-containing protein 1 isoform X1 n=1 Tax=Gavialis gangeticus TaxID=94835 RepID=UPI00092E3D75|nr:PREDICTED: coiled-coil-helix-coiled-coil-helix domain-containing protein 1 isoform X1 [Gavialis gangeticus]
MVSPVSASCLARLGLGGNKRYQRIRPPLPLVLDNRVLERRQEQPERPCLTEMMLLMSCWKKNEFSDPPCAGEIRAFHDCLAKSKVPRRAAVPGAGREEATNGSGHPPRCSRAEACTVAGCPQTSDYRSPLQLNTC